MSRWLRVFGWLVMVGGSFASITIFWVEPMNSALRVLLTASVATCVTLGLALLGLAARLERSR